MALLQHSAHTARSLGQPLSEGSPSNKTKPDPDVYTRAVTVRGSQKREFKEISEENHLLVPLCVTAAGSLASSRAPGGLAPQQPRAAPPRQAETCPRPPLPLRAL